MVKTLYLPTLNLLYVFNHLNYKQNQTMLRITVLLHKGHLKSISITIYKSLIQIIYNRKTSPVSWECKLRSSKHENRVKITRCKSSKSTLSCISRLRRGKLSPHGQRDTKIDNPNAQRRFQCNNILFQSLAEIRFYNTSSYHPRGVPNQ